MEELGTAATRVAVAAGSADGVLVGGDGDDQVIGGDGRDVLVGGIATTAPAALQDTPG
jgi:Ca2+-binding RTX toxin-like protein